MKVISLNTIESAAESINNMDTDQLISYSERCTRQHEALFGYIYGAMLEYENPDLDDLVPYYAYIILEAFRLEGIEIPKVDETDLEAFDEQFVEVIEQLYENDSLEALEEMCEQPWLLEFMKVEVNGEDEAGQTLKETTAEQLFLLCAAFIGIVSKKISA